MPCHAITPTPCTTHTSLRPPLFDDENPDKTSQRHEESGKQDRQKSRPLALDKLQGLLALDDVDAARLVAGGDAVALVGDEEHLRPEGGADELAAAAVLVGALGRDALQHRRHRGAVLRVQVGVDLVEQVEGRRVALLDREDERERAETWVVLV